MRPLLLVHALAVGALLGVAVQDATAKGPHAVSPLEPVPLCRSGSKPLSKVELLFGVRPGTWEGRSWHRFLATVVTPRFPKGLTVVDAAGQWHSRHGLERESSRLLIIFYQPDATSNARIEAIRSAYKTRFKQQSVLRADSVACVSF